MSFNSSLTDGEEEEVSFNSSLTDGEEEEVSFNSSLTDGEEEVSFNSSLTDGEEDDGDVDVVVVVVVLAAAAAVSMLEALSSATGAYVDKDITVGEGSAVSMLAAAVSDELAHSPSQTVPAVEVI